MIRFRTCLCLILTVASFPLWTAAAEKLEPEEIVRRHLGALGPAERISSRQGLKAQGTGILEIITGGSGRIQGQAALMGQGSKIRLSIVFGIKDYPAEEVIYDGRRVEVGYLQPGIRSQLGQFLVQFDSLLSEGLLGGVLSPNWPLLDHKERKAGLKYEGLKNVDEGKFHSLRYSPRKGSDVQTRVYFDSETFRHIHSVHRVRISAPLVASNPDASANQHETWYTLRESFSNFHEVDGLMLPAQWVLEYTKEVGREGSLLRYTLQFSTLQLNPTLDPSLFQNIGVGPQ